jgi:hypothetical protein
VALDRNRFYVAEKTTEKERPMRLADLGNNKILRLDRHGGWGEWWYVGGPSVLGIPHLFKMETGSYENDATLSGAQSWNQAKMDSLRLKPKYPGVEGQQFPLWMLALLLNGAELARIEKLNSGVKRVTDRELKNMTDAVTSIKLLCVAGDNLRQEDTFSIKDLVRGRVTI